MGVVITGSGMTKFGEIWNKGLVELGVEAGKEALKEAGLEAQDIDGLIVGNMLGQKLHNQGQLQIAIGEQLGITGEGWRVESACASGGLAVRNGVVAIESGMVKRVLVIGVEKMTDFTTQEISQALMTAGSEEERWAGFTFPAMYAVMANMYQQKYGVDEAYFAWPAIKAHWHASKNPLAHFQQEVSLNQVLHSPMVASPIRILNSSPISDGAAAVVLERKRGRRGTVEILASSVKMDTLNLSQRQDILALQAVQASFQSAQQKAKINNKEIDVIEIHDCFSVAEILVLEAMGLAKKGQAGQLIAEGWGWLGRSKLVINPSGGLKACGHPVGATGVKQIVEIYRQLSQQVEKERQVKGAELGITQNMGGSGAISVVHILRRIR